MKNELLKVEGEKFGKDIPLLDNIYVILTRRKHESGYMCMEIIGTNDDGYKKKLATYCDVFDINRIFSSRQQYYTLSMDIPEYGVMRFFSMQYKFKVKYYGISTFSIDVIERR